MKEHSVSTPEPEDNFVSDFSVSFVENVDCHDASALKDALMFLKGTLRAREEDLASIRKEKDAALESKITSWMEYKQAKRETEEISKKLIQAEKEKEAVENALKKELAEILTVLSQIQKEKAELMMDIKLAKSEVVDMGKKLVQAETEKKEAVTAYKIELTEAKKEKESAMESKIDLLVEELKQLKKEVLEKEKSEKTPAQNQRERKEATEEVELCKEDTAQMTRKLTKAQLLIEEAMKLKGEMLAIDLSKMKKSTKEELFSSRGKELGEKLEAEIQVSKTESKSWNSTIQTLENVRDELNECMKPFSVWKRSGTMTAINRSSYDIVDVLNCPPLKAFGIFEWKIRVEQGYNFIRLGVISSSKDVPWDFGIGYCEKSWGYYVGTAIHDSNKVRTNLPKCSNGSVIHFRLDLTGNGTLSVSVSGSSLVEMFTNMISSLDEDEGFLPAVSLRSGAKIELLANDL